MDIDYWFAKYDSESFEKDFTKVSYNDILQQLVSHPDFTQLPNEPPRQPELRMLQECLISISEQLAGFFSGVQENSMFGRWVRIVQAYQDCEKLYAIMFWGFNFIPNFVECRVYASYVRLYKFLISLTQNVTRSNESMVLRNSELLIPIQQLEELQRTLLKPLKPLIGQHATLLGKLYYFIYHMADKPISQLRKDLDLQFGTLEINWVRRILSENQFSIQQIDAHLEQPGEQKDQFVFEESEVLKMLVRQAEDKFSFYKVEPTDASILEKSKKHQLLEQIERKARREIDRQSTFVQNYKDNNNNNNTSLTQSDGGEGQRRRKFKATTYVDEQQQGIQQQISITSFQESEVFRSSPNNPMKPSTISQISTQVGVVTPDFDLSDQLMDYISKADASIVEIKDEHILFDDANKKKRYRLKKRRDENESPDLMRKQTQFQAAVSETQEEDPRRIMARRLMDEQNQQLFEKLKMQNTQEMDGQTVKDTDLFQYSFEDSVDDDSEEESKIVDAKEHKVPMPKNYSQNTEGIIFHKFQAIVGDTPGTIQVRRNAIIKKLYYNDRNSSAMPNKQLITDFGGRNWDILKEVVSSTYLAQSKDKISEQIQNIMVMDFDPPRIPLFKRKSQQQKYQLF